jgi:hypothetical protein
MPVLENAGNTSIESNATENAALFITTGNKTTRLQDLYYAQSKSQGSGWIPIGAETKNGVTTVAIKHTYQDPPDYGPYYQAIDFDPISGAQVGIHAFGGSYFTREQQIRLNAAGRSQEIIDTAYFGDQTEGEFLQRFDWVISPSNQGSTSANAASTISAPSTYGENSADIITNYNPNTDGPIQIDLASFAGAAGKLKIAKKTKQVAKLAKKNIDFIYDQQAGYLYYNENGKQAGFGDGGIFAILEGSPKAAFENFQFA